MPLTLTIRFYEELNDFIPAIRRKQPFSHTVSGTPTIKDIIESLGVPHTEVDLILVNSQPVDFSHKPKDGDFISIYPVYESLDISGISPLRPEPLREPAFIADVHLGRLARYLRLMGFDTYYRNDLEDNQIMDISVAQKRIILTRDLQLLKNNKVTHGYFVRSAKPEKQVIELIRRFELTSRVKAFHRCTECNGLIIRTDKEGIEHLLKPGTWAHFDEFFQCTDCQRVYWKGSHYDNMLKWVSEILRYTKG